MVKLALVKKNPSVPIKICFLAEVPEVVPKLVKLFQEEWEAYVSKFQKTSSEASADDKWQMMERIYKLDG